MSMCPSNRLLIFHFLNPLQKPEQRLQWNNKRENIRACWNQFIYVTFQATEQGLFNHGICLLHRTRMSTKPWATYHPCDCSKKNRYTNRINTLLTIHYSLCTVQYIVSPKIASVNGVGLLHSRRVRFARECSSAHCGPWKHSVAYVYLLPKKRQNLTFIRTLHKCWKRTEWQSFWKQKNGKALTHPRTVQAQQQW